MNLIYLALLCGLITTSFVHKSEARLHAESIVGGTVSAEDQNTYAVSIQIDNWHHCGGGILNNRYIISAAHCFIDLHTNRFDNANYIVVAGVTYAQNAGPYRVSIPVEKIYIPREFNPRMERNFGNCKFADIAILELPPGLGLNQFITNVVLPPNARRYPTYKNERAVVCGYGHNWVRMRHDPHINQEVEECSGSDCYERRFAEVNIISNMACRNFFRDIMDSQLCGHMRQRSPDNPEGLCTGDSGSPLVIGNTIVGVVCSNSRGCREDLKPAVYSRVTSFIPFIMNAMNGVRTADMRLAKYEITRHHMRVLVEQ